MNTEKIKELSESLSSIKNASFYHPNWAFIGFKTDFISVSRQHVIRTSPLNSLHSEMTKDLNEAIAPVLKKYAAFFEEAIRTEATTLSELSKKH